MQPYGPPPGGYGYANQNPYAPPNPNVAPPNYRANVYVPPGSQAGALPAPWLRKGKLACGIAFIGLMMVGFLFIALGVADHSRESVLPIVGMLAFFSSFMFMFGYQVLNWIWTYQMWSWIPPEQRHTKLWKKYISPGTALGFMFIPYFNIYWLFVIYLGFADVLERMSLQYPTTKESPKTLAIVRLVVPLIFFPAGPFVDYIFDRHVESMALEMSARMGRPVG